MTNDPAWWSDGGSLGRRKIKETEPTRNTARTYIKHMESLRPYTSKTVVFHCGQIA